MTKKNHLETRTITTGKKNIIVDFVSAPPLFNQEQIQEIRRLLTKYCRKGYKPPLWDERGPHDRRPPERFDPIQKIIFATKFFLAFRAKKTGGKNIRTELKIFRKTIDPFCDCIIQMHEETLKYLGLDAAWQNEMEIELSTLSNKALVWLKEHPTDHRRYELEARLYFSDLILIYEKATGQKAGSKGRFFNFVSYILQCIDPDEEIIWQTEQALRQRIITAKEYLKEQEFKQQEKNSKSKKSRQRKTILTSFQR